MSTDMSIEKINALLEGYEEGDPLIIMRGHGNNVTGCVMGDKAELVSALCSVLKEKGGALRDVFDLAHTFLKLEEDHVLSSNKAN